MNSLNLSNIKKIASLLFCTTLFACSSTEQVNNKQLSDNTNSQSYVNTSFPHTQFTPINKESVKKPLYSDHQLMMSLLNRPMTADQAMMLSFAKERARYSNSLSNYANNGVMIKGSKTSDNSSIRAKHVYAQLISQDINAVSIIAPQ